MLTKLLLLAALSTQTGGPTRQPVEVPLPDPVAVIVSTDQPTILMRRCEAYRLFERLDLRLLGAGAGLTPLELRWYTALSKALFVASTASRPEAPHGATATGDLSGCVKATATVR